MGYTIYLRERYSFIAGYTGLVCSIIGLMILSPLIVLPFYPEESGLAWGFIAVGLFVTITGLLVWRAWAPTVTPRISLREGAVVVLLSWLIAILAGTVTLMTATTLDLTEAIFESTSGWTTTGLSVVDVTVTSHIVLLFRSIMQLAGGAGFAIIVISVMRGRLGPGLARAEGRTGQLVPHVRQSARIVLSMYSGYTVIGVIGLYLAGMGPFDAFNHAFCAVSTGGFSTRAESIGYWDSAYVEGVTLLLMLLGTTNFLTSYALIRGKFDVVKRAGELRLMAVALPIAMLVFLFSSTVVLYPTLGKQIRVAVFEAVTALSTTGYSTVSYSEWPPVAWVVLLILMLIGGGTGSTAGGLKQYRIYVLVRGLTSEFKRFFLPETSVSQPQAWQGEQQEFLTESKIFDAAMFSFLYLSFFALGSAVLAAHGYSLSESLFEFASTVGTVGLSVGVTSADAPDSLLWMQIVGMLLGRLEFFVVVVGSIKLLGDVFSLVRTRR